VNPNSGSLTSRSVHPALSKQLTGLDPLVALSFECRGSPKQPRGLLPIESLRIGPGHFVPDTSNHSLYLVKLIGTSNSYPERHFGENQLLDGSISLSPLYPLSDDRFARQNRFGLPPGFPLASSCTGKVHHLSGPML